MANTTRTPAQQALWDALPGTTTARTHKHYENLTECPDEICEALTPMAWALHGCGWDSIQASAKLKKLSGMTLEQIQEAFSATK
jgi:hypothetical protein